MGPETMTRPEDPDPPDPARPEADPPRPPAPPAPEAPAVPPADPPAADPAADLPPLSAITARTDLAPFLRPGVPAAIRNAALRRKWLLNPTIRDHVDPALDYAWDWNAATPVPGAAGRVLAETARKVLDNLTGSGSDPGSGPPTEPGDGAGQGPHTPPDPVAMNAAPPPDAPAPPDQADNARKPVPEPAPAARRHGGAVPRRPAARGGPGAR